MPQQQQHNLDNIPTRRRKILVLRATCLLLAVLALSNCYDDFEWLVSLSTIYLFLPVVSLHVDGMIGVGTTVTETPSKDYIKPVDLF
jgi:hypothetical protein